MKQLLATSWTFGSFRDTSNELVSGSRLIRLRPNFDRAGSGGWLGRFFARTFLDPNRLDPRHRFDADEGEGSVVGGQAGA